MTGVAQTPGELEQHLREQLDFLRSSSAAFDQGRRAEAKRLAISLRILLHHNPARRSNALLSQLGQRDQWLWLDSAGELDSYNLLTICNLVSMRMEIAPDGQPSHRYEPHLGDYPTDLAMPDFILDKLRARGQSTPRPGGHTLPVEEWWTMAVIKDNAGETFSRQDLVLAVANQDGGGHVDPAIAEAHHRLSRSNSLGWSVGDEAEGRPHPDNPVLACLRQVAYEVDTTVVANRPDLVGG